MRFGNHAFVEKIYFWGYSKIAGVIGLIFG